MVASRFRFALRIPLPWLLFLALVLPVAQVAAIAHTLSHVGHVAGSGSTPDSALDVASDASADTPSDQTGQVVHKLHCDLCVAAAAVSGGAPVVQAARWSFGEAAHDVYVAAPGPIHVVASSRPYESRAPPLASR